MKVLCSDNARFSTEVHPLFLHRNSRQQLINLLDYAVYIRNLGLFILVLFQLNRVSFKLEYKERDQTRKIVQITG